MPNNNPQLPSGEQRYFHSIWRGQNVDPIRPGLNVATSPAQGVFVKNAPLPSFANTLLDDLQSDVFLAIVLADLHLYDYPPEGRETNRALLDWLMSDPKFGAIRLEFSGLVMSGAGVANEIVRRLLDDQQLSTSMSAMTAAGQAQDQADELRDRADRQERKDNGESDEDEKDGDGDEDEDGDDGEWEDDDQDGDADDEGSGASSPKQTPQQLRDQADELEKRARQHQQEAQEYLEKSLGKQFSSMTRAGALGKGEEVGQQMHSFLTAWGVDEENASQLTLDEVKSIMRMMTDRGLSNLTSLIGRVAGTAAKMMEGRSLQQVVVSKFANTKRLKDVKLHHLAMLTDAVPEQVREKKIEKFIRSGLPGVRKSMQAKQEGSFIVAKDRSGSMKSPIQISGEKDDYGRINEYASRGEVATALELGLVQNARMNGQHFICFGFGLDADSDDIIDNETPLTEVFNHALKTNNGGTDFDRAMKFALLDLLESLDEDERLETDIVFITDGQAGLDDDTIWEIERARRLYQVRIHVLQVGTSSYYEDLVDVSDNVVQFTNLDDIAAKLTSLIWDV